MNNFKNFIFGSKKRLAILILAVAAFGIPLTVTLISQQQDIRQRAQEVVYCRTSDQCPNGQFCNRGICSDTLLLPSPTGTRLLTLAPTPTGGRILPTSTGYPSPTSRGSPSPTQAITTPFLTKIPTATPTLAPIPPGTGALIDLNDDGKIDELDLNILYSGFSRRKGD